MSVNHCVVSCCHQHKHLITIITAHCLLTTHRTESQAEFLRESHGAPQTDRPFFFFLPPPPLKSKSLRLLHILSLSCHHILLVARPSVFAPLSDLRGRLPVYVRRASSQSAVKAVILLVAIYYPVVWFKKRLKDWAKLGAGCWVSRHAKLQSESTTDLYTSLPSCIWKCVYLPVHFHFVFVLSQMCCRSKWSVHLTCLSCFTHCSRICTLTFFACRWGLECAGLQVLKITKQREAAACKLWMRSQSADTARAVTREGILFWILPRWCHAFALSLPFPLFALCTFFFPFVRITTAGYQKCMP